MNKRTIIRIVVGIIAVISTLVTLASFGTVLPSSPFSPIALETPVASDSNGDITLVADKEARRLLVLNDKHQLTAIVSLDSLNSPVDAITDVCISNNALYVCGVRHYKGGDLIEQERIVRYDMKGRNSSIVYETKKSVSIVRSIVSIFDSDRGAIAAVYREDEEENKASIDFVQLADTTDSANVISSYDLEVPLVHDVGFSYELNDFIIVGPQGLINDAMFGSDAFALDNKTLLAVDMTKNGTVIVSDDISGDLFLVDESMKAIPFAKGHRYEHLHANESLVCGCSSGNNMIGIYDFSGNPVTEFSTVPLDPLLSFYVAIAWACRIALVALLVWAIIHWARAVIKDGIGGLGALFASTTVVVSMAIALGYASYGSYKQSLSIRANEINTFADYLKEVSPKLRDDLVLCGKRDAFRRSDSSFVEAYNALSNVDDIVGSLCTSANTNEVGSYFAVYAKDEKGIFYLYDSAMENVMGTSSNNPSTTPNIEAAFSPETMSDDLHKGQSLYDETQYRLVSIPSADSTSIVGVIEIGSSQKSFEATLRDTLLERTIAILAILLVVYISYVEIRHCGRCLLTYRELQRSNAKDSLAVLTRPFSFCVTTLSSIDAVMSTLIAKALLQQTSHAGNAMLVALPAVMLGLGMAVGHAAYGFFGPRIELRKLMARSAAIMALGALAAMMAVGKGSFELYCAAKLTMALPFGLLYTLSYSLPRRAETPEVQQLAAGGIKRTDTSAAAFGTVLGAFAASTLGNAWVYVVVALASLAVMMFALMLFPANGKPLERERNRDENTRIILRRFLFSRETLADTLLIMFPATIAAGYNSFLFPLFSSNVGLSTATINNLCVLGQLVVLVCIPLIESLESRHGKWSVSISAVALLGATFLLFLLNNTLYWAVFAIALVGVLKKASDGWKGMWLSSAKKHGLPAGKATGAMFATNSVELVIRPLMLGFLVTQESRSAPLVLGVLCVSCAILFFATTRSTVMRNT